MESPRAASGRATPIREAAARSTSAASRMEPESSHDLHTPPRGFLSHVRYQFVDCRWSLDDPGLGRRLYLEAHIPGAAFLDVEQDLSAPPGRAGRHPLPAAEQFAAAASAPGSGQRFRSSPTASLGGAERLWWLLRHFGHDACAVIDLERVARPAPRRRGAGRGAGIRPGRAGRRRDRPGRARGAPGGARRRRRPRTRALARRAEPPRPRAGADPRRAERALERRAAALCRRASSSRIAARASPRASCCTASTSPGGRASSTRARGRSGSSIRNCR